MTDEQAGIFFKAIYYYQATGNLPKLDFGLKMAIAPFVNQFQREDENYKKVCETRKKAGSKGGKQKVANASKCYQKLANAYEKDKDKDKEKDNDKKEEYILKEKNIKKENENSQPQNPTFLEAPNNSNSNVSEISNIKLANTLPVEIADTLIEDDKQAINLWLNFKKEQKKAYKSSTSIGIMIKNLQKLAKESNATMREIVENSIANNYQGLFSIRKQQSNQNQYVQNGKVKGFNISKNSIAGQWLEAGDGSTPETRELDRQFEEGLEQFERDRLGIK